MENFIQGFLICAGLITTIGAQNAFLIKQALLKQHTFILCSLFFLCDCLLFVVGIFGLGSLISQTPIATIALAFIGGLFLFVYGLKSFISAYQGKTALQLESGSTQSLKKTILIALAITLLNPHVYLDTVVIIGGIAGTLNPEDKLFFLLGTSLGSGLWFFGVGYGARLLIPFFQKAITWRVLDFITGIIMWGIAVGLVHYGFSSLIQQ